MKKKLKGYKTLIAGALGVLYAVLPLLGIELSEEAKVDIEVLVVSVTMIVLRLVTTTPVGKDKPDVPKL